MARCCDTILAPVVRLTENKTWAKRPGHTLLREPLKIAFVTRTSEIFVSEAEVKNRRRRS